MNWGTAVIIGLCALNFLMLLSMAFRQNQHQEVNLPAGLTPPKRSDGRVPLNDPDPYKAEDPKKDNGSVILLTAQRDDRLLADEE